MPNMGEVAANLMLATSQNPDARGKANDSLKTTRAHTHKQLQVEHAHKFTPMMSTDNS